MIPKTRGYPAYNLGMPRPLRSFRVEAIVLKHNEHGEADRLLTVYTRERGKLKVLAKGVRKLSSRKAGHVEPFSRVTLLLATGSTWYVLQQAEAQETYNGLRADLTRMGQTAYAAELLDRFTIEEEEHAALYRLLAQTLGRLATEDDIDLVIRYYEMRLLDNLGFRPELQKCVVTGAAIVAEDQYFSASLGGAVSAAAGRGLAGAAPVSLAALKYMRHMQRSSYREAQRARIGPEVKREMEILMQHYITYLLERGLNSPAFLRRLRQDDAARN
ncbi:MAG: DNA repair protein RecO [Anaerolineae bacterium]|nr:MAG: DNA repair protein RecO [Anaerolineae bacterium]